MVSEDSDQLRSGLAPVPRFDELDNLEKASRRQVPTTLNEADTCRELLEVLPLRRSQRMLAKERNHRLYQVAPPIDDKLDQVFLVIVVAPIRLQSSASEEAVELLQR